jgi:hypothetical protein
MALRKGGWKRLLLIVPIGCGLVGWFLANRAGNAAQESIGRDKAALKALGIPVEPKDFATPVADADNAFTYYEKALAKRKGLPNLDKGQVAATMRDISGLEKMLAPYAEVLALAKEGATKEVCNFKRDWANPNSIGFYSPSVLSLKEIWRPCLLQAELDCLRGRFQSGLVWLKVAETIAVHLNEPTLIGTFHYHAAEGEVVHRAATLIRRHGDRADFREPMRDFVASMPPLPNLQLAMGADALFLDTMMDTPADMLSSGATLSNKARLSLLNMRWLQDAVKAKLYSEYLAITKDLSSDPEQWAQSLKAFADQSTRIKADTSFVGGYLDLFIASLAPVATIPTEMLARRRLLAAELLLLENTKLPLDAPIDPYSGKPFLTREFQGRLEAYSVGKDLADGRADPKTDVVLTYGP